MTRLLIPPFVLTRIGLPAYSVWSAIFMLVSYVGITTMGVSVVYIKYTAEFTSRGEMDEANSLLSTGMFATAAICALIFGLLTLELHQVLIWLHVPASLLMEAQAAVLMVIATRWHAAAIMSGVVVAYAVILMMVLDRVVLSSDERNWFRSVIRREASSVFVTIGLGESNERAA